MQRRDTLKWLGALPLAGTLGATSRVLAAPAAPAKLLFVFLRGGYDAASLLVPTSSDFYYEARPNIAIARPSADKGAGLALNADWALHPALQDSVYPLFGAKQVAFVPFCGTDDLTRSHFETQDTVELGQGDGTAADGTRLQRDFRSGFMNRLAAVLGGAEPDGVRPIAFTDQLPRILQGSVEVANVSLRYAGKGGGINERQSSMIAAMYSGHKLDKQVREGFETRSEVQRTVANEMAGEMVAANRNAINARGFELEARRVAALMREKYALGFIDVGGWDTHVNQGTGVGYLANRFDELGRGLATFAREMGPDWNKTVVVVASEFGRTFRENGNRGTDHGHGTVFWVLGGGVKGGIAGEQVAVNASTLFQDRDYPVLNEYRTVLGGLFARMYGLNAAQVGRVFPGVRGKDLRLV